MKMGLGVLFRTQVLRNAGQVTDVPVFLHYYDSCFVLKVKMMPGMVIVGVGCA